MRKVQSRADLESKAGRKAAPAPAAPAPAPAPAFDDKAIRQMQEAVATMAATFAQLPQMLADAARPVAPPAPHKRVSIFNKPAAPAPAPVPEPAPVITAPPAPAAPPDPITAHVHRDKRDRLTTVTTTGGCAMKVECSRDGKDRINELFVVRDGERQRYAVKRNQEGRIESIAPHPATL